LAPPIAAERSTVGPGTDVGVAAGIGVGVGAGPVGEPPPPQLARIIADDETMKTSRTTNLLQT
jgi:hypothetical protein